MVLGLGGLLALAFAISIVRPELSLWAYGAAALVGLVPFARRAFVGALSGTPFSIETLMTVAAAGAIAIGAAEEAAVVIFLFAVGELLETVAAGRARAGIKALIDLVPRTARIEEAGQVREVPVERLRVGDIVVVRPGDRVPSDGEVIEGQSEVDEAPVTGESVPVAKGVGDQVYAGSINANGMLRVRLTHTAADNTIARIIHLVEEAQGSKAPDRALHRSVLGLLHAGRDGGGGADHCRATACRRSRLVHLDLSRTGDAAHRLPLCACDLDAGGNRLWARVGGAARASHQGRSSLGNPRQGQRPSLSTRPAPLRSASRR